MTIKLQHIGTFLVLPNKDNSSFLLSMQTVGLIIGVVPQFRKLLVRDSAPLFVVQDSLAMVG